MSTDGRQAQEEAIGCKQGDAQETGLTSDPARSGGTDRSQRAAPGRILFRVAVIFILLGVCALQGVTLQSILQGRADARADAGRIQAMQSQLADLQGFLDTGMAEDLIFLKLIVLNPRIAIDTAREIATAVLKNSRRYKRDSDLILAMMKVESNFDPAVVSKKGAIGLMQVMPQWIDVLGISCNLQEPDCNVAYGLQIMGVYEQLYRDPDMALTAYNRGPGPVDNALMKGKSPDNGYAESVRAVYARLQQLGRSKSHIQLATH